MFVRLFMLCSSSLFITLLCGIQCVTDYTTIDLPILLFMDIFFWSFLLLWKMLLWHSCAYVLVHMCIHFSILKFLHYEKSQIYIKLVKKKKRTKKMWYDKLQYIFAQLQLITHHSWTCDNILQSFTSFPMPLHRFRLEPLSKNPLPIFILPLHSK